MPTCSSSSLDRLAAAPWRVTGRSPPRPRGRCASTGRGGAGSGARTRRRVVRGLERDPLVGARERVLAALAAGDAEPALERGHAQQAAAGVVALAARAPRQQLLGQAAAQVLVEGVAAEHAPVERRPDGGHGVLAGGLEVAGRGVQEHGLERALVGRIERLQVGRDVARREDRHRRPRVGQGDELARLERLVEPFRLGAAGVERGQRGARRRVLERERRGHLGDRPPRSFSPWAATRKARTCSSTPSRLRAPGEQVRQRVDRLRRLARVPAVGPDLEVQVRAVWRRRSSRRRRAAGRPPRPGPSARATEPSSRCMKT